MLISKNLSLLLLSLLLFKSVAGWDFERYLQPTARCSLSPVQGMAVDRFSLGLQDAEMESPQAQAEEPVHVELITPTGNQGVHIAGVFHFGV